MIGGLRIVPLAVLLLAAAACEQAGITSPATDVAPTGSSQFSEQLSLPELQQSASSAAVRVEVKLRSAETPLVAREVEHADAEAVSEAERIESRVTAADAQGVTLALGALRVTFDAATTFRSEGGESLTQEAFVAQLQEAIAAGRQPAVEARRAAPAEPQAPEDAVFLATELEIDDEASEPRLEMNIDADNLQLATAPATGAILRVLGLSIEIRGSETQVEKQRPGKQDRAKFEGIVASADQAAGTVTLRDGRVIRVVEGTEIETGREKLGSVAEVAAAVAAGKLVEAEGKGVLESPTTLVAVEVEFEVEEEADDVPHAERLKDAVASVDVAGGTFTLTAGQVVRVVEGTRIKGKIASLQELADALAAQRSIRAETKLLLESAGPPARYIALEVHFKAAQDEQKENAPGRSKIHGRVTAVDAQAGTLTLASRDLVRVTTGTAFDAEGDLATLQAAAEALAAGRTVKVEGEGTLESAGPPRVVVATRLKLEVDDEDDDEGEEAEEVEFESTVASVDVAARSFTLADGRVVRLAEEASIKGDFETLQEVADALSAERTVQVEGEGSLESAGPPEVLVAHKVEFESEDEDDEEGEEDEEEVEFESTVASVDVAAQTFTLASGQVVRLTADTSIGGDLRTLQAVLDALTAGRTVEAEGKGTVESEGPPATLVATRVKFKAKKS